MQHRNFQFDNPPTEDFPLEINGEVVMCVGEIDGLDLIEYMAVMNNPHTYTGEKAQAIDSWFRKCIKPGEYDKFRKIVSKYRLDVEQLSEISGYLSDCYSSVRPTEPASSSASGQTTTGPGSEADSSEKEETSAEQTQ